MKKLIHTQLFEQFINENKDEVIFSVDDEKLDQILHSKFGRKLDYEDIKGDSYYSLPKREFDSFIDFADSSGFDVDYDESEASVIYVYESRVNEVSGAKPAILVKLFKELAKAKNVEKVSWGFDGMEEFPHIVHFASGLESEAPRHEGEMEEFSFYLNDDGETILGIYDLSGNDQDLKTVKDAVEYCRANEK